MRTFGWVLALAFMATIVIPVQAQEAGWAFETTPYFWGFGIDGQVGIDPLPPADVDIGPSDVLDNFEAGFALYTTATRDRWLLALDVSYLELESSQDLPAGKLTLGMDSYIVAASGGYRVTEDDAPASVVALGGARYERFDTSVSVAGMGSASRDEDWIDPFVGATVVWPFADGWTAVVTGNIGGFGVGSDLAWELMPLIRYEFSPTFSAKVGYRMLDVDYEDDGYLSDTLTHGWLAGVGIAF